MRASRVSKPSEFQEPTKDAHRRKQQAQRIAEIIQVHRLSGRSPCTCEQAKEIAKAIGRSERTVWRHLHALRLTYEILGTTLFDGD